MFATRAFFSFSNLRSSTDHRPFNEWHQLDHRPENLLLPGVAYGERWVRSPVAASLCETPDNSVAATQYMNMYWFRPPFEQSIAEWNELAEVSKHWGRRFDLESADRMLIGFFRPLKGYVSPRVLVSAEALPFRPSTGVLVTVTQVDDQNSSHVQALAAWYDREYIPALVATPGVTGAWTFVSDPNLAPPVGDLVAANVWIHLAYLDGDIADIAAAVRTIDETVRPPASAGGAAATVFLSFLQVIEPWKWDWFDEGPSH